VFVGVCVLQCQQQEAGGEDQNDGEDFAEGFEVVHGSGVFVKLFAHDEGMNNVRQFNLFVA
jgi:hypothetical protein